MAGMTTIGLAPKPEAVRGRSNAGLEEISLSGAQYDPSRHGDPSTMRWRASRARSSIQSTHATHVRSGKAEDQIDTIVDKILKRFGDGLK
jgi:hypothetical protein